MGDNSKSRRRLKRAPECIQELIQQLPGQPQLLARGPGSMGWSAEIAVVGRKLRIDYDRGYLEAYDVTDGSVISLGSVYQGSFPKLIEDVVRYLKVKGK
jgi:hypothetical protein